MQSDGNWSVHDSVVEQQHALLEWPGMQESDNMLSEWLGMQEDRESDNLQAAKWVL